VSAILEVVDVVRTFGAVRAVDGATFAVEEHSVTGLIGPNGAGKSTLFATIAGSLKPSSGRIVFSGTRIDRKPEYRVARAGVVRTYQASRVLTRMSVLDNLLLASKGHPGESLIGIAFRPRAARVHEQQTRARAHALLELVGLDSQAHAYAGTLSGGQRKLLDLTRILMLEPSLILLDEPMAGVAPVLRVELLEHILAVRRDRGITFLIVEHDLDFVMQAADRVVVMNEGRILTVGTPAEVRSDEQVVDAYLGTTH
jgi:ABC-type branched-subunit amino acid transport system ATPase component